jgi:hypothetical protein
MHEDPSKADVTAKIFFEGVMLLCAGKNRCEVGIILCRGHEPKLKIQTRTSAGTVSDPPRRISNDLFIQVVNPKVEGISRRDVGDDHDFKFVPDLEGGDFHGNKVDVNSNRFGPKLAITAGLLYSRILRPKTFEVVKWSDINPNGTRLGRFIRIADDAAINIDCRDDIDSGINIIDTATGKTIRELPRLPDTFYTIEINNECEAVPHPGPFETDFRFYYQVITAQDGQRFDLLEKEVRDPAPRACETGFLGRTDTFDFSFEPQEGLKTKQKSSSKRGSKR